MRRDNEVNKIERAVIFGSGGFIGSHLKKSLESFRPKLEVRGLDISSLDLTNYEEVLLQKELFNMKTAIVMCAALKKESGDNVNNFLANLKMTANICNVMQEHPVRRFIFLSSAAVYGEETHNLSITEDTILNPTSYYGIAKCASEALLQKTMKAMKESSLVLLRPPAAYGPRDNSSYGPTGFIKAALKGENITLWGDGSEKREFIFIDDLVKIISEMISNDYCGILNTSSGKSHTFAEI